MFKSLLFALFALGAVFASAAFMSSAPANATPSCHPGIVYQDDSGIHNRRSSKGGCVRHFDTGQYDYDQMIYTRRGANYDYSPGFGIYPNNGYWDRYSYNDGYSDGYYHSRHRRHCRTPNIWRNHHPVWITRCSRHHHNK